MSEIAKKPKQEKKSLLHRIGGKIITPVLTFFYVLKSKEVSFADKAKICGSLVYIIFPFDFIPDFIPFAGYGDDLATLIWAIHTIHANNTPEIKNKTQQKLSDWFDSK